ncbi:hypothetical protein [Staphylococcus phage LY01]|nr:hypothetical protein [Staphylococcus phage LY01]
MARNKKFNTSKIEKEFRNNSSSKSSRKYIDTEFNKNLNNINSNDMKRMMDQNNPLKAVKELKNKKKKQLQKISESTRDLSKEALESTKNTFKTGETIQDKGSLKNFNSMGMDFSGDFEDFSFDDSFSDIDSDIDNSLDDGDFKFDDFDKEDDNKSKIVSSTTIINNDGSSAKSTALLTSSVSNLSQINTTGFTSMINNLNLMREANDNIRESMFQNLNGLIQTSNAIRQNTKIKNISEIKNSNSLEDLFLSNITLSNILEGSQEEGFKDKAKDFIKKQGTELLKEVIGSKKQGIKSSGLVDLAKGKAFDFLNNEDTFIEKAVGKFANKKLSPFRDNDNGTKQRKRDKRRDDLLEDVKLGKSKLIDKIFDNVTGGISTANKKDRNQKVAFDVETHNTINTVIPGYLSKIVGLTSEDGQEIHYDYDSGSFKTSKSIKNDIEKRVNKTIKESSFTKEFENMASEMGIDLFNNESNKNKATSKIKEIISRNINKSDELDQIKSNDPNDPFNILLDKIFNDKEAKTSLTKTRMQLNKESKDIKRKLSGSSINALNDKSKRKGTSKNITSKLSNGNKSGILSTNKDTLYDNINFNIVNRDISEIKKIVSRINNKIPEKRYNNSNDSKSSDFINNTNQSNDNISREIDPREQTLNQNTSSRSNQNREYDNTKNGDNGSTIIPNEQILEDGQTKSSESSDNKDFIDRIEEAQDLIDSNKYVKEKFDKYKNKGKNFAKEKIGKLSNTKLGSKITSMGGALTGKFAAGGALMAGAGSRLKGKLKARATRMAAGKGTKKAIGKGLLKAGSKVGARVGLNAIPVVGQIASLALAGPDIIRTIANPIESLKHPIKTLGSIIGFNDHPSKTKKEQEKLDSTQPGGENFAIDPLVDTKMNGSIDKSSIIGDFIKDNPLLASTPLLGLAGMGLYKSIVKPAFGLGMNMVQKTTGMAKSFGDQTDMAMEEKTSGFGGLIKKVVGGASMLMMAPLALAGKGLSNLTGMTSTLLQGGTGLIKSGWNWLNEKFSSYEEEMGNMSKEMTEASKEELSSYQEGIESEASDRAKKEIAEMQGMSDKANKDAEKQVKESAEKTRDDIKKDVDETMKNSPLSIMGRIGHQMNKLMPKNLMSKLKKTPKKLAETMMRMSPFYTLLSKKKKKKSKLDINEPGGEVVNTIGDWFDKLGGMMNDIMAGFMAGSGSSSAEASEISDGDAASVGGEGAEKIWNFLTGKGLSEEQVAGILGNFEHESGNRPDRVQGDVAFDEAKANSSISGYGIGIAQWDNVRRQGLMKYAKKQGKKWSDLDLQLDYLWYELQGPESAAFSHLKSTKTVEQAAASWVSKYERAGVPALGNRVSSGNAFLKKFSGSSKKSTKKKGGGGGGSNTIDTAYLKQFSNMSSSTKNINVRKVAYKNKGLIKGNPPIQKGGGGGGSSGNVQAKIKKAVEWAKKQVGASYSQPNRDGANSFDCSSLVYRSYRKAGLTDVPQGATTHTFWDGGTPFEKINPKKDGLKVGDIILCANVEHVTIYIGNGKQVESNGVEGVVINSANKYKNQFGIDGYMRYKGGGPSDGGSDSEESGGDSPGASEYSFKNGTWYGSITGRDDNRMDEEEQEALNDRLMKRYAQIYGIDYEEAKKIDQEQQEKLKSEAGKKKSESGSSSGSEGSTGSSSSSGSDGRDGSNGQDGSSSSTSGQSQQQGSGNSSGGSTVINNGGNTNSTIVNNNYTSPGAATSNSTTQQIIQGNNNTVRNIYNITNNYNNSTVSYKNGPMKVDNQKRMDLDEITKHTSNIDKNTAKMLEQLKKMSFKGNNSIINNKGNNIFNNTTINDKGDLVDPKGNVIIKEINKEIDKIIKDNLQNNPDIINNGNINPNDSYNPGTGGNNGPSQGDPDLQEAINRSYGDQFNIDVRSAIPVFSGK